MKKKTLSCCRGNEIEGGTIQHFWWGPKRKRRVEKKWERETAKVEGKQQMYGKNREEGEARNSRAQQTNTDTEIIDVCV